MMRRVANKTFETVSDMRADIHPPAVADKIPPSPRMPAARRSTLFFERLRNVPMIAVGMMTATEVPFAMADGICKSIIMAGTITTPPPTPSSPAKIPVATPIATRAAMSPIERTARVGSDVRGKNNRTAVTRRSVAKPMARARCGNTLSNRVPSTAPASAPTARHAPTRQST